MTSDEKAKTFVRIEELQGDVQELADMLAALAVDAREHYDERSERWQDSAAGEAYAVWASALEEAADAASETADIVGALEQAP